jgi:DNA-binding beta-propeller fold protein YncE
MRRYGQMRYWRCGTGPSIDGLRLGAIAVATLMVLGHSLAGASAAPVTPAFPHTWYGDIDKARLPEPSGLCYHPVRGTLFAVGDGGHVLEMTTNGTPVKLRHVGKIDFEGITVDPSSGLLYIAVEGADRILEMDPEELRVQRTFQVPRTFEGRMILKPGGNGIEAITFIPSTNSPNGGTFIVANQVFELNIADDRSALIELEVPLRAPAGTNIPVRVIRVIEPGVVDMSALHYDAESGHIFVVSDTANLLLELARDGALVRAWAFPGKDQEGLAVDPDGYVYTAQDSGGITKCKKIEP